MEITCKLGSVPFSRALGSTRATGTRGLDMEDARGTWQLGYQHQSARQVNGLHTRSIGPRARHPSAAWAPWLAQKRAVMH